MSDITAGSDTRVCFNCGKSGHFAKDCRSKGNKSPRLGNGKEQKDSSVQQNKYGPSDKYNKKTDLDKSRRRMNAIFGSCFDTLQGILNDEVVVDVLLDSCCTHCSFINKDALDRFDVCPTRIADFKAGTLANGTGWESSFYIIVDLQLLTADLRLLRHPIKTRLYVIDELDVDIIIGLPDIVRCDLFSIMTAHMKRSYDHMLTKNQLQGLYRMQDRRIEEVSLYHTSCHWFQEPLFGPNEIVNEKVRQLMAKYFYCFVEFEGDMCQLPPLHFECHDPVIPCQYYLFYINYLVINTRTY